MSHTSYTSPFSERYGTKKMRSIFSDRYKHLLWRSLWYDLARAEYKMGVEAITIDHINEICEVYISEPIDYDSVKKYEDETHHDVVAHLMEFSDHCPTAKNILHLGATSCYITDNSDILIMKIALAEVRAYLKAVISELLKVAEANVNVPLVGRTHLQKAQLTTVGKRICMWVNDLMIDYDMVIYTMNNLKMLGCKGATGSQSSLYTLFDGDYNKAQWIDQLICKPYEMQCVEISGQTYTRKYDSMVAGVLSQIAQSASKFATDMRLMSSFGEAYEHFSKGQVGSSAMPYKRNPLNCEKICGIARYVICNAQNMDITVATQWLERTLDDSSNKRIVMPQLFLGISEILKCMESIIKHMVINEEMCIKEATEHAKMASLEDDIIRDVMSGGDRLEGHKDAIYSDGSDNARINTGFAAQQAMNFIRLVKGKLGND